MQLPSWNAQRDALRLTGSWHQPRCHSGQAIVQKETFDTALETSQALEAAMKNAKEMQDAIALTKEHAEGPTAAGQVHQLHREGSRKGRGPCYRCGGSNHMSAQCVLHERPVSSVVNWDTLEEYVAASLPNSLQ